MVYGYARVSTAAQKVDRQIEDLHKVGLADSAIFIDKESGKDFVRTNYQKLKRRLKPGDVLFVKSIDRLGRDYAMILDEWRELTKEKGIDIVIIDMPLLDTRIEGKSLVGKFIADVVLQVLSFVAENERATMKQRQAEGIRMAKLRGVKFGRPSVPDPENIDEVLALYKDREITSSQACEMCALTRGTFYRRLKKNSAGH
ncbi:MAG: recombinase family protein [Bacilli bacterium]|nr:recombinase family protein [Bacilli bacterium]